MRKILLSMFIFLIAAVLVACASEENNKEEGSPVEEGGTLTVGAFTEPDSLDPHNTGETASNIVTGNIGASLVFQNPETNEFEPYLAEKWETSEDGKTWTFTLRDDLEFHDGSSLTAEDFEDTYKRAIEADFVAGSNLSEVESIQAVDEKTLELTLEEPYAPLLQYLSDPGWLQPLPSESIADDHDFSRDPIGAGPWEFESWKTGESITLSKNANFDWGPDYFENNSSMYPDQLEYKFIEEGQTLLSALDSGSIDVAANIPANQMKKYQNNDDYYILERPRNGLGIFGVFNLENPHFEDINIRKAINYGIDKEAIAKTVMDNLGEVSYGPLPSSYLGYDEEIEDYGYHFDSDKATELIEESGYTLGDDNIYEKDGEKLEIELMSQTEGESWNKVATLMQSMLKDIGIKISVETRDFATLLDTATKHQFEMTLMGYTNVDPDVISLFLDSEEADGGLNTGSIDDQELDDLLLEGKSTADIDDREAVYSEIQKHMVDKAYWVPIITENQYFIVNKDVSNLKLHPLLNLLYNDSTVESND